MVNRKAQNTFYPNITTHIHENRKYTSSQRPKYLEHPSQKTHTDAA